MLAVVSVAWYAQVVTRNSVLREVFEYVGPKASSKDPETLADQRVPMSQASSPETMKNVPLAPQ